MRSMILRMNGSIRLYPVSRQAGAVPLLVRRLLATLGFCAIFAASGALPASAQGYGFFGDLFGGGRSQQQAPPPYPGRRGSGDAYGYGYGQREYAPHPRSRRHRAVEQAQGGRDVPKEKPPSKSATVFVDVFGDALGQQLANGLDDALSDRADVGVIHRARGSSGLVSSEVVDWSKTIDDLLAGKDRIDVAVMMVGSNDRQPIQEDGKTYPVASDEWDAIYKKRVLAIDEAFRKKGVPLIWVGVPIIKNSDFADAMAAFNDIYREAAAKTGATFVDTWEAFSDDNGDFDAFGPDVNGQTARLRTADGIYFTKAGARKLAHFVETHIRRDLDGKGPVAAPPSVPPPGVATIGDVKKAGDKPVAAVKPDAGPVNNLTDLPSAANGELARVAAHDASSESTLTKGETAAAPVGRADDLRWSSSVMPQP